VHGPETKNKEKIKQKPNRSEETVQAKIREGTLYVCFINIQAFLLHLLKNWT